MLRDVEDCSDSQRRGERRTETGSRWPAYSKVMARIAADECVVLDGGTATEIPRGEARSELDEETWGLRSLLEGPAAVREVHQRYVALGCDVIATNTWGLPTVLHNRGAPAWAQTQPVRWLDLARLGVRMAREAVAAEGREGKCAVALSLNADLDAAEGPETVQLLARALAEEPPDLILWETLSLVRDSVFEVAAALVRTGWPVWLSFRRCRHGLCGVFGQHWGGPEGDAFGRAARRLEELGAGAVLINCLPPDHVDGMVSYLRDFTDLPLGVYPNLGYHTTSGWQSDPGIGGAEYAEAALRWREEGAQLIGGCCGVSPQHIAAAAERLAGVPAGHQPRAPRPAEPPASAAESPTRWTDPRGRSLYPLPFPDLLVEGGVFVPTEGSFLVWKHLLAHEIGADARCLDVGCGAGLQTVQLARNGATHVHAIDLDPAAVDLTLTNAFRNGVAERVSAATMDLYPWVPEERYEVIVASLYQTPVDPSEQLTTHRPLDYWGRNLLDHLIGRLPNALTTHGAAYVLHLSILSQQRTKKLLAQHGLTADVVDFAFFPLKGHFAESKPHIDRVEQQSDAYHLQVAGTEMMVAYLLEITWASDPIRSDERPQRETVDTPRPQG